MLCNTPRLEEYESIIQIKINTNNRHYIEPPYQLGRCQILYMQIQKLVTKYLIRYKESLQTTPCKDFHQYEYDGNHQYP